MELKQDSPPVTTTAPPSSSPGLTDEVIRLSNEMRELVHDQLELVTLETRQCINSLLSMAVIAIVAAVLLVSTWLALVGAGIMGLINLGLAPSLGMLLMAAANLVLALLGWMMIRQKSSNLGWPATLRMLKPGATPGGEGNSS